MVTFFSAHALTWAICYWHLVFATRYISLVGQCALPSKCVLLSSIRGAIKREIQNSGLLNLMLGLGEVIFDTLDLGNFFISRNVW